MKTRFFKTDFWVISILFILVGLCMVIWPQTSQLVICYILGAVLLLIGIVRITGYFVRKDVSAPFRFDLSLGICNALIGLVILLKPDALIAIYGILAGITLLLDAAIKIQMAFDLKRMGYALWYLALIFALVTGILGVILVFNPFTAADALAIFVGIALILDGGVNLWAYMKLKLNFKETTRLN